MIKVKRALISVSDKTGLEDLVKALKKFNVEILSTGGTAKAIAGFGVKVTDVSDYTGLPEMLDGRVKTLHPKIHGGLLAVRDNLEHMETLAKYDIGLIDMVVVNLYPFEETISHADADIEEAVENIDIGGPSMLRSAAKNCRSVCVLCDPSDYYTIIDDMENSGGDVSEERLKELAVKAFQRTSAYDAAIYSYLRAQLKEPDASRASYFPELLELKYRKMQDLRYGENPHQKAAFYKDESTDEAGLAEAAQLNGRELSYNNIMDLDAALQIVSEFNAPAAVIVKHTNPCGCAVASDLSRAYLDALNCDRMSAFGSILGFNCEVDIAAASTILKEADFVECMIAPSFTQEALDALRVKKNLRILALKDFRRKYYRPDLYLRKVVGGLLAQDRDRASITQSDLKYVTKKRPTDDELKSLLFGWSVVKHVKSNAIVLSRGTRTVAIGAGQMSRVESVSIAVKKAGDLAKGAALASEAFFPKEDNIDEAARHGISAIIQPGGSIKDAAVIKRADELGIAMVFTGIRHFKH